ncbi:aspartate/glutamate racemase family protein [Caballeronia sp. SEWSISQ10-4 2]|uniref:aspartate/glutamate racemase family protein n=1 Tax=Caballeronia sp. SEWSISQ10-4 2 TaxID=2937438 RepID=UPI0026507CE1|nr:aspartate/glutamate racemase family protein [Caballeronia sp. SEWSISQ10-4 2]MDN7180630.1 aspartate/glutamate racemase family protein [Caballeronia sp. SEWSISQ10-4 2]
MIQPIHVINPNSLADVTGRIDRAVQPGASTGGPALRCITLETAPPGIVSQRDADSAATLVADYVERNDAVASAFVIACYSDPGLFAAREITKKPVIGIGQAGLSAALQLGERVGVIAVSSRGIPRHLRYYRTLGVDRRIAGELAIDLPVADSGDENLALQRLIETAKTLRDDAGADVIVLGCAGMAELRSRVEAAVGVAVVDPCTAAVAFAIARVKDHAEATRRQRSQGASL